MESNENISPEEISVADISMETLPENMPEGISQPSTSAMNNVSELVSHYENLSMRSEAAISDQKKAVVDSILTSCQKSVASDDISVEDLPSGASSEGAVRKNSDFSNSINSLKELSSRELPGRLVNVDPSVAVCGLLEHMCVKDPKELLNFAMESQQYFLTLFENSKYDVDVLINVVEIVAKMCSVQHFSQCFLELLSKIYRSTLFTTHIAHFMMSTPPDDDYQLHAKALESLVIVYHCLLRNVPFTEIDTVGISLLLCMDVVIHIQQSSFSLPDTIMTELQELQKLWENLVMVNTKENHDTVAFVEIKDFREIPIYPTEDDIFFKPCLSENKVKGRYLSVDEYLCTHFQLMREDYIGPLREAIMNYVSAKGDKRKSDFPKMNVAHGVRIGRPNVCVDGVTFVLRCDSHHFGETDQNGNRRMMWGSLLCLSADGFKSFLTAVVAQTDERELKRGTVRVRFVETQTVICYASLKKTYVMIESPAIYEAYKYVLMGLKNLNEASFPFRKYFIDINSEVNPPQYLKPGTRYALPFLHVMSSVELLNGSSWPEPNVLGIADQSQLLALQTALTQELAVIQGPPGTGKTYLGLKIVEILLSNAVRWNSENSPILVVCFTNHALDQFLKGIIVFMPTGVVRVGNRSKCDAINKCSISALRRRNNDDGRETRRYLNSRLCELKKSVNGMGQILSQSKEVVFSKTFLKKYMMSHHYQQFVTLHDDGSDRFPVMHFWLEIVESIDSQNYYSHKSWLERGDVYQFRIKTHIVSKKLKCDEIMHLEEVMVIDNVWSLCIKDRWRLYRYWIQNLREEIIYEMFSTESKFSDLFTGIVNVKDERDISILKKAKVIGMTTSGAARSLRILQNVKPKVVIVEEAAEVLESHILASLNKDCEHLILIGDHKQLRPKPNVYELAKDYKLDVSLFERIIDNGIPFVTLALQHRMRPQISSLLVPYIYESLENHASVELYEDIRGISTNLYFVDHTKMESQSRNSTSFSNQHEAALVASLCKYLIQQEYKPSQITVLTTYISQMNVIKTLMQCMEVTDVACTVVDNFQGEENDIILLSLVRSNQMGRIGFLNIPNRICVLLSRAKKGFYCFGNFGLLTAHSNIWKNIVHNLKTNHLIGPALKLKCPNHPETVTEVMTVEDFLKVPQGGCAVQCEIVMHCGHLCPLICHGYEHGHYRVKCKQACEKHCSKQHRCLKLCWEDCGKCKANVTHLYDECGHEGTLMCYENPCEIPCKSPCQINLDCGHQCKSYCGVPCIPCSYPCCKVLPCGHQCKGLCGSPCPPCSYPCDKMLPCGHQCKGLCGSPCPPCSYPCDEVLPCGHQCKGLCGSPCPPCSYPCDKMLPCGHQCGNTCGVSCAQESCLSHCTKTLSCGHLCQNYCGSPCTSNTCEFLCKKLLLCGHYKEGKCGDPLEVFACEDIISIDGPCGHSITVPCIQQKNIQYLLHACCEPCLQVLSCGHLCQGTCGECAQGRGHIQCKTGINHSLVCGHEYQGQCFMRGLTCYMQCMTQCRHGRCPFPCGWHCMLCYEQCSWNCEHYRCHMKCFEVCDRPPCDAECLKQLACGHQCIGLCGETCPPLCRICDFEEVRKTFFGTECEQDARFVLLEDCGHTFEVSALDRWINDPQTADIGQATVVKPKLCPKCNTAIVCTQRYSKISKTFFHDNSMIKCLMHASHVAANKQFRQVLMTKWELRNTRRARRSCGSNNPSEKDIDLHVMSEIRELLQRFRTSGSIIEKLGRVEEWFCGKVMVNDFHNVLGREVIRIKYWVSLTMMTNSIVGREVLFNYVQPYYDAVMARLTSVSFFTIQMEQEVKEHLRQLESYLNLKFPKNEIEMNQVCTYEQYKWFKCICGQHYYSSGWTGGGERGCLKCN